MTATAEKISISSDTVRDARETPVSKGATLALVTADGSQIDLPPSVQETLLHALASIAERGRVTISEVPDKMTSTTAADVLGVSRPTLMKWVREGRIDSFKVGTHTRFRRDDVLALKQRRSAERQDAFTRLRELDAEHPERVDD